MGDASRLRLLTERERAALRLIYAHKSVKEAALDLSVSPTTVETYLLRARRKLAVDRSLDAARLLIEAEAAAPADGLVLEGQGQVSTRTDTAPPGDLVPLYEHDTTLERNSPATAAYQLGGTGGGVSRPDDLPRDASDRDVPASDCEDGSIQTGQTGLVGTPSCRLDGPIGRRPTRAQQAGWGGANDLTLIERLGVIALIMVGAMMLFALVSTTLHNIAGFVPLLLESGEAAAHAGVT